MRSYCTKLWLLRKADDSLVVTLYLGKDNDKTMINEPNNNEGIVKMMQYKQVRHRVVAIKTLFCSFHLNFRQWTNAN